jgi:hypothetical protein
MPRIPLNAAHGLEDQHRHLGLRLVPRQRHARDRGPNAAARDVPGTSMVEGVRDHIILAFRAVTISRLQIAEAEKDFMHGFFDGRPGTCAGLTFKTPRLTGSK